MEEINKYKKLVEEIENYIKEINKEYNEIKAKSYGIKIEDSYCEDLRKGVENERNIFWLDNKRSISIKFFR